MSLSMESSRIRRTRRWLALGAALLPLLTGCSGFFPPIDNSGGGGTTTGNLVYVGNQTTSSIGGFSIGTSTLTAVSGSPVAAGFVPLSMAVTKANTFLYVGGLTAIELFAIGSNGSLATGTTAAVANAAAMTISPDGNWLIVLDGNTQVLDIYAINTSTGALTLTSNPSYGNISGTWKPSDIKVSPNGTLIFAALGTAGDQVFSFDTATGAGASVSYLPPVSTSTGDNGLAVNPAGTYLFIARSGTNGGVAAYSIAASGILTSVTASPFAAGTGPASLAIDSTGTYLYAGNRGDGTISGYTIAAGTTAAGLTLTALSGSPYTTGTLVQSIGIDSTGKYLLAAASGGSPDLTMYTFDITTPGKLDAATSIATATDPAGAAMLALTH